MRRPEAVPSFSKALLAGALTGLVAAVVNIVFDIIFRGITRYLPAEEFNFFSITFASMIVLVLMGLLFFVINKYLTATVFTVVILIIVIGVAIITGLSRSSINEPAFYGNHGLIAGFTVLSGLLSITLLPYLYRHPKIFI